jgi:hypothetical protein
MTVTMQQVRLALVPEEPDYQAAAEALGREALPYLKQLSIGTDVRIAARATYLAGVIGSEEGAAIVAQSARNGNRLLRVAAASAARHLYDKGADDILLPLINDVDLGVQKVALKSIPPSVTDSLLSRIEELANEETDESIRALVDKILVRLAAKKQESEPR